MKISGRQIKVRHFRGNNELPWIVNDRNFDALFPQSVFLTNDIKILPGDQVTVGKFKS